MQQTFLNSPIKGERIKPHKGGVFYEGSAIVYPGFYSELLSLGQDRPRDGEAWMMRDDGSTYCVKKAELLANTTLQEKSGA